MDAPRGRPRSVAVMQPYFYPYAGYFRLFEAADAFVLFDCVQFPRRGRVHRTEVPGPDGSTQWLTLPLARQARDTLICDLAFADDARRTFDAKLARLPWIREARGENADRVRAHLFAPLDSVVDFVEAGLRLATGLLGLPAPTLRSSALRIDHELSGQLRVLEICKRLGAGHYINAPGGRDLYDAGTFARSGVRLEFLPPFEGTVYQMLPALLSRPASVLRADIAGTRGQRPPAPGS